MPLPQLARALGPGVRGQRRFPLIRSWPFPKVVAHSCDLCDCVFCVGALSWAVVSAFGDSRAGNDPCCCCCGHCWLPVLLEIVVLVSCWFGWLLVGLPESPPSCCPTPLVLGCGCGSVAVLIVSFTCVVAGRSYCFPSGWCFALRPVLLRPRHGIADLLCPWSCWLLPWFGEGSALASGGHRSSHYRPS